MSSLDNPFVETIYDAYRDFGLVGDHRVKFDGATTGGTGVITTAAVTMNFTNEDVGRRITLAGAGVGGAVYVGVITGVNTTQSVNVTPNTTTTVSGRGIQAGTDNTNAINALVTFVNTTTATFPGIKVKFGQSPTNSWGWPVRAAFTKPIYFEGIGGNFNVDDGDYTRTGGTRLAWWSDTEDGGTEFGPWMFVEPAVGSLQPIVNPSFTRIWFDGRNGDQAQALIGVKFAGCVQPILEDVFFIDCKIPVLCESTTVTLNPQGAQGVLRPSFSRLNFRNLETFTGAILTPITCITSSITLTNTGQNQPVSAATMPTTVNSRYAWVATNEGSPCLVLYTGGGTATLNIKCSPADALYTYTTVVNGNVVSAAPNNGPMMYLSGNVTSNTNCGLVQQIQGSYGTNWGPAGIELRNSDSMSFKCIYMNGGSSAAATTPAVNRTNRPGVRICGSNHATQAVALAARNHTFLDIDPGSLSGGNIATMGLLNTGAKLIAPSGPNYAHMYQLGNGAPLPTQESFSSFNWSPNGGLLLGGKQASVANQAIAAATLTQITGSLIALPPQWCQAGTVLRWTIIGNPSVSAAAASTWAIRLGPLGTTADPTVFQPAFGAGTAGSTVAFRQTIDMTVRVPGVPPTAVTSRCSATLLNQGAVGITNAAVQVQHANGTAFNANTSGLLYAHISFQGGAGVTTQIEQVYVEVINPANP